MIRHPLVLSREHFHFSRALSCHPEHSASHQRPPDVRRGMASYRRSKTLRDLLVQRPGVGSWEAFGPRRKMTHFCAGRRDCKAHRSLCIVPFWDRSSRGESEEVAGEMPPLLRKWWVSQLQGPTSSSLNPSAPGNEESGRRLPMKMLKWHVLQLTLGTAGLEHGLQESTRTH